MFSNIQSKKDSVQLSFETSRLPKEYTWEELVDEQVKQDKLKCRTCKVYSTTVDDTIDEKTRCVCGRLAHRHSFIGEAQAEYQNAQKWRPKLAAIVDVTIYGQLKSGARFIRCDSQKPGTMETLVQLIVDDMHEKPKLLISCYGGADGFTMTDSLEKEFMNGIGQLAATKDVWVLTAGLNSGVSKLIGQGIHRHILLNESAPNPIVIGMTSWGTITEYTRSLLKAEVSSNNLIDFREAKALLGENVSKNLDLHHTHFVLLDDGHLNYYINDGPRTKFVKTACEQTDCHPVTIIVEGGVNTLEVILNDLQAKRPVVIVDGSGRLANVLGKLLENASETTIIGRDEVKQQLRLYPSLWPTTENDQRDIVEKIEEIFDRKYRQYLNVFQLGCDTNLTNTIFRAVFDIQEELKEPEKLLELAVTWNCVDGAHDMFQRIQNDKRQQYYPALFEQALKNNRPLFVDYILRRYHNPLEITAFIKYKNAGESNANKLSSNEYDAENEMCVKFALQFIVEVLYKNISKAPIERSPIPKTLDELDEKYSQLVGSYIHSFYRKKDSFKRFWQALSSFGKSEKLISLWSSRMTPSTETLHKIVIITDSSETPIPHASYRSDKQFGKQEMFRDLFLWSVYVGYVDIAFVLLLQLKSRIGAALVAAGIAKRLSSNVSNLHIRNRYNEHRIVYEEYATACIEACYRHNERLACELLLREILLFGNITCMQAAIASGIIPFVNTDCFNQVLNRQWSGQLDRTSNKSSWTTYKFIVSLASFGLLAPLILDYRLPDTTNNTKKKYERKIPTRRKLIDRALTGIEDQSSKKANYWHNLTQFHASPIVKMSYEFIIYIWFLLAFSYMMLFCMEFPHSPIHWTEIYVIVAVSAALMEQVRKVLVEFHTQMLEGWDRANLWMLIIYAIPYILFYIGIGLRFGSITRPYLFASARIVLAIDLELWYLFSLRFVSAVKLLGPKLFMMRNMIRYLAAFMYIIFVCIAAYGVVSRALTMYSSLEFTARNLSNALFYRPYWFLYSVIDDEKNFLDGIISSDSSSSDQVAEAMVTHILLAFHMLFINILILSLLIAVFNFAINDVQEKNEYFWRYQRYALICEYFEKPAFAFPPLSLLVYVFLLIRLIWRRRTSFRVFKRLATDELDIEWTDFENAATYEHARDFVEKKYRSHNETMQRSLMQPASNLTLQTQVNALNEKTTQMQNTITEMQSQTRQTMTGIDWMMKAMDRVKMSSQRLPPLELLKSSDAEGDSATNK